MCCSEAADGTLSNDGGPTKSCPGGPDLAGVLGLEPRTTGPEPAVLPITPYPMGVSVRSRCDRPDHHVVPAEPTPNVTRAEVGHPKRAPPDRVGPPQEAGLPRPADPAGRHPSPSRPRSRARGRPATGSAWTRSSTGSRARWR